MCSVSRLAVAVAAPLFLGALPSQLPVALPLLLGDPAPVGFRLSLSLLLRESFPLLPLLL
jgi:hypothetical protein